MSWSHLTLQNKNLKGFTLGRGVLCCSLDWIDSRVEASQAEWNPLMHHVVELFILSGLLCTETRTYFYPSVSFNAALWQQNRGQTD